MKESRFSEEQRIGVLQEGEAGMAVQEICRQLGIGDQTYYRWKASYGGREVAAARRLRHLEEENQRRSKGSPSRCWTSQHGKGCWQKRGNAHGPPGKPLTHASVESCHGKFREEGWNQHGFLDRQEARETIEAGRQDYHQRRPHSALGYRTPEEFTAPAAPRQASPSTSWRPDYPCKICATTSAAL